MRKGLIISLVFLISIVSYAQNTATLYGKITDEDDKAVDLANISIRGLPGGTSTDKNGNYSLTIPANQDILIIVSYIGFSKDEFRINLPPGASMKMDRSISFSLTQLPQVVINESQMNVGYTRIDPKIAVVIPTVNEGIESILKTLPGVYSHNELSSQYSVRGGNYDENLVYVNDIEIYRPFLIRSGEQEGLSFINSDLVSSITFSAGGFDAKYGDKMSSALDIKYKKPDRIGGSVNLSLLGVSAHAEGCDKKDRISFLFGFRQKSNQYLLKSLETKGDYKPSFTDIQTLITAKLSKKFELSFLGNYARNKFLLVPQNRETDFGTVQQVLRLKVYFDGQEVDMYETLFGAMTATYSPTKKLQLKLIASSFNSSEQETFDIQGQYWLDEVQSDFGKDDFGKVLFNKGVGTYLNHARNYLNATVINTEHRGRYSYGNNLLLWGVKYQREIIDEKIKEWKLIDSAGFTLPHHPDSIGYTNPGLQTDYTLEMRELINSKNTLSSNRMSGFIQNTWNFDIDTSIISLTAGIRFTYWDMNYEWNFSPRASISFKPDWEKDVVFRLSGGIYYQPPFYRELRDFEGNINKNLKAQRSIHIVMGSEFNFSAWRRPFKFIAEAYYKYLTNLIPYEVDNVRIRYYAKNDAKGYTTGIDLKLFGEFVKGIDSWLGISLMSTKEDISNDSYMGKDSVIHYPGYIPRPTDQILMVNLFFQDYIPKAPTWKMHLNLIFGTGLPFGPPNSERYKQTLRMPPYRRVDIGFSKQLISEITHFKKKNPLRHIRTAWISLEVFNLLQISNTVSYLWVTDVNNQMYAVPNYLTPRLINLKLNATF